MTLKDLIVPDQKLKAAQRDFDFWCDRRNALIAELHRIDEGWERARQRLETLEAELAGRNQGYCQSPTPSTE